MSDGIPRAFGGALGSRLGLTIEVTAGATPTRVGVGVLLTFALAGGGVLALALPIAVLGDAQAAADAAVDGRIAAALVDVEVDVVAELGKVRLPLSALSALAVGDIVHLSLPLDERARVCAGGAVLFRGRPTASGGTIGIAIEGQAT